MYRNRPCESQWNLNSRAHCLVSHFICPFCQKQKQEIARVTINDLKLNRCFMICTLLLTFRMNSKLVEILCIIIVTVLANCFYQIKSDHRQIHLLETCRHVAATQKSIKQTEHIWKTKELYLYNVPLPFTLWTLESYYHATTAICKSFLQINIFQQHNLCSDFEVQLGRSCRRIQYTYGLLMKKTTYRAATNRNDNDNCTPSYLDNASIVPYSLHSRICRDFWTCGSLPEVWPSRDHWLYQPRGSDIPTR